jgi:hypothetical protein
MHKMTKMKITPVTPKTANPASVFTWLAKYFNATKHQFQSDSNPYANYSYKTGDILFADRKHLVNFLTENPEAWKKAEDELYFTSVELGVSIDLRSHYNEKAYSKHFSISCPKKSKPFTVSYYD